MASVTSNDQRLKICISGIFFIWTLSIFLPGAYSIDSWNQFNEMQSGRYDDWYGVGLAVTWRKLWLLTGNSMSLYVMQMLAYWVFFTLLLWRVSIRNIFYWAAIVLALFFCFIPQYIMRDSLTVIAWGLGAVLLIFAGQKNQHRRGLTLLAIALLAYGLWVRINTLVALLPMLWVGWTLLLRQRIVFWKQLLLTLGLGLVIFGLAEFHTYKIAKATRVYPEYKQMLLDLANISRLSGHDCYPACIREFPTYSYDTLMSKYTPASIDDIYWPADTLHIFAWPTPELNRCVRGAWFSAIRQHPLYYLEGRFSGFLYYLHIRKRFSSGGYWNVAAFWIQPNGPKFLQQEGTPLKQKLSNMWGWFYTTILYDPWVWLLLNMAACICFFNLSRKKPNPLYWIIHANIQLSGVLYTFSQVLIFTHDRDFRYSYWNVFVAFFALAALISQDRNATEPQPDTTPQKS